MAIRKRNLNTHWIPCDKCGCPMKTELIDDDTYQCKCVGQPGRSCGEETKKPVYFET